MLNLKTRAYIYRVLTAAAPLAALYGIASDTELVLWLALAATVLGTGLAAVNTPAPKTVNDDGAIDPGSAALGALVGAVVAYLILR